MKIEGLEFKWLGHDGFIIKGEKTIGFDPYQIKYAEKVEILFITHEHFDHCSPDDIVKLIDKNSIIVCPAECISKVSKLGAKEVITISPNEEKEIEGIKVKAIPAYNLNKFRAPNTPFHPKSDGKLGYIVTMNGKTILHVGDTDGIDEIKELKGIDIALLPVSGTYVMTAKEAADLANTFHPKIAIPMHFDSIVGTRKDAEEFKELYKGETIIPELA